MRLISILASTFFMTSLVGALSLNPPDSVIEAAANAEAASPTESDPDLEKRMTNAERLRRGLGLNKPRWWDDQNGHSKGPKGKKTKWYGQPRPSARPSVDVSGYIFCTTVGGGPLGYLSPQWNKLGEYGYFVSNTSSALGISIKYCPGDDLVELDLLAIKSSNPYTSLYPYVGAVRGYSCTNNDFNGGSFNYAYIAGTKQSSHLDYVGNSYTQATHLKSKSYSSGWTYEVSTSELAFQWTNTDNSEPSTYIAYSYSQNVLALTGDVNSFGRAFGGAVELTCKFVKV